MQGHLVLRDHLLGEEVTGVIEFQLRQLGFGQLRIEFGLVQGRESPEQDISPPSPPALP